MLVSEAGSLEYVCFWFIRGYKEEVEVIVKWWRLEAVDRLIVLQRCLQDHNTTTVFACTDRMVLLHARAF